MATSLSIPLREWSSKCDRELASSCSEPVVQLQCNASEAHYVKLWHFFFQPGSMSANRIKML